MRCSKCGSSTRTLQRREMLDGTVVRRRHECSACQHRFNTVQLYDTVWGTFKRWALASYTAAVLRRWALHGRNQQIVARLRAGEKHASIAADFGLADNSISTIARNAGLPSFQKLRRSSQ